MEKMIWNHVDACKPQQEGALYMVSDGHYVGVGVLEIFDMWNGRDIWASIHLDEDDMDLVNNCPQHENFVFWAQLYVPRFGMHELDPQEAKMLCANDELIQKMRIIEQFGPDMLKDDE